MSKIIDFPSKSPISTEYRKILRNQHIDEKGPGTVVRDFETFLDFIGPKGTEITPKTGFLTMKSLVEINKSLSHPLRVAFKRPMQKSFPHIGGLYLLVRTSGMAYPEGSATKRRLVLNDSAYKSWGTLNPAERYFTLLESWLLRGSPEILRENIGYNNMATWSKFFSKIPERGLKIEGNRKEEDIIRYIPGLYTIALLEMFGLISVLHGKPEEQKGWNIRGLKRTPFGNALLELLEEPLRQSYGSGISGNGIAEPPVEETFGKLRPLIRPYFPKWQKCLEIPRQEFRDGIYIFNVCLGPKVWRRIAIPGTMTLEHLSSETLDAFDFDHDHLYTFTFANHFGINTEVTHPYIDDNSPCADEFLIGNLPIPPRGEMTYLYDFGDNWEFLMRLEKINPPDPKIKKPVVLESFGKAPEQYQYWDEEN